MFVIDVTSPDSPRVLGHYGKEDLWYRGYEGTIVSNDTVYLTLPTPMLEEPGDDDGLYIIDASQPATPRLLSHYYDPVVQIIEFQVVGQYAYVADDVNGLQILDISNPASLRVVGRLDTLEEITALHVVDERAYVGGSDEQDNDFHIVDVSDPTSPVLLDSYDMPDQTLAFWSIEEIDGNGSWAYLLERYSYGKQNQYGLQIFDVSDPTNISPATEFPVTNEEWDVRDMQVVGTLAYLTTKEALYILNVSTPTFPVLLSSYVQPICDFQVVDTLVYFLSNDKLHILDVSDPANPVLLGKSTATYLHCLFSVAGDLVYAWTGSSIKVFDVRNPASPVMVTGRGLWQWEEVYARDLDIDHLYVQDNLIYLGGYARYRGDEGGLQVLRVTRPTTAAISGSISDEDGKPLSGVTITTSDGSSASSASDGSYTVTGMLTGTHTLTPTLAGYTFEPATRTVSVPPDATGQDFTAVAVPAPDPTCTVNYATGQPGSTFIFTGQHLPISATVSITINGVSLPFEPPLATDETGTVVFMLRTGGLEPGTYVITITAGGNQVSLAQQVSASITLEESAPLRTEEDSGPPALDVPTTVQPVQTGEEEWRAYLPLVVR